MKRQVAARGPEKPIPAQLVGAATEMSGPWAGCPATTLSNIPSPKFQN
jgi:hypothetical protein